jgi:hypothetical protein
MFIGISSVNRGKITSTNSTHPTSQIAQQIPAQRNARNERPIAKRFSAGAQIALFSHCSEWPVCELHQKDKRSGTENALCIVFEAVFETYFYVNLGLAFERSMVSSESISLAGS